MLIWKRFWKLQAKNRCMLSFGQVHTYVQSGNGADTRHGYLIKDQWNFVQRTIKSILIQFKNGSILYYQRLKGFNTPWVEILLPSKSRMNMGVITHKVTYI